MYIEESGYYHRKSCTHKYRAWHVDAVCGMSVDPTRAEYHSFQMGQAYYFCSAGCKEAFDKDSSKYIARPVTESARG
jgi:Cu+-exporting ATPase